MVPLRLTTEQPVLVKATLYCAFLNVRSDEKEIATQYLENCLTYLDADAGAYLYSDAQPIEDKQFLQLLTGLENAIRSLEKRLSDESLTPLEQTALRDQAGREAGALDADVRVGESLSDLREGSGKLSPVWRLPCTFKRPACSTPRRRKG